jgi:hypothetical protein
MHLCQRHIRRWLTIFHADQIINEQADTDEDDQSFHADRSPSPLAGKGKSILPVSQNPAQSHVQHNRDSSIEKIAAEHDFIESDGSIEGDKGDDDDDEWVPPTVTASKKASPKNGRRRTSETSRPSGKGRVPKLEEEMNDLALGDDIVADDSIVIIPAKNRPGKNSTDNVDVEEDSEGPRPAGPKKKKR